MRIIIDLQGAQSFSRYRGIGRYALSLAQAIARNRKEHEIIIVLNGVLEDAFENIFAAFSGLIPRSNLRIWNSYWPLSYKEDANSFRRKSAEALREAFIESLDPDIILLTSVVEGYADDAVISIGKVAVIPTAAIFYDAIPLIQPEKYIDPEGETFKRYYYDRIAVFKKSQVLFGISESSCREAIDYLDIEKERVVNIAAAVDERFRPIDLNESKIEAIRKKFKIEDAFLLYSGASDERKNHKRLIRAYAKLPKTLRERYQLVLAGGIPDKTRKELQREVSKSGLKRKRVVFTRHITDDELLSLYTICTLYVFPSLHEGFGLPALEAMSCGVPVIGSNTTSIPEVIGREDALFDPSDENAIAKKITEVLTNDTFREELAAHSLLQAKKFSWDKSAKIILQTIEERFEDRGKCSSTKANQKDFRSLLTEKISLLHDPYSDKDLLNLSRAIVANHRQDNNRQLFVDISELIKEDARSGIQRVVRSILNELISSPPPGYRIEPVYATMGSNGYCYAKRVLEERESGAVQNLSEIELIDFRHGDLFLGLDLSPGIQTRQKKFYKRMLYHGVDIYFIVYDILLLQHPQWWPPEVSVAFQKAIESIAEVSTGLICISKAVADDLGAWLHEHPIKSIEPLKIDYFHLGADIENSQPSKGMPENAGSTLDQIRSCPSFLMVGTIEPRKGHEQALDAFEQLWRNGKEVNLVIVGKKGWLVDELVERLDKHPKRGEKLFWLHGISDEYLESIYEASTCLLAPSFGEGFGLPLIEAAQHHLPIIARDLPVFHEVGGGHAFYFDNGRDPEVLAHAIEEWLKLYTENKHPKSEQIAYLTWKESCEELKDALDLYSN